LAAIAIERSFDLVCRSGPTPLLASLALNLEGTEKARIQQNQFVPTMRVFFKRDLPTELFSVRMKCFLDLFSTLKYSLKVGGLLQIPEKRLYTTIGNLSV
jgi:hypothetical protein